MPDSQEKLLAEIRDLLASAIERERIRSDARDAQIESSIQMQRSQGRLYRRVVIVGAVLVAALLIFFLYLLNFMHR